MGARFPARMHVLLAAAAPVGVVLRRGPSNTVCSVLWSRRNDTFEVGQWLRARIYEHRCDISPDGRHLIYFARNSKWSSETRGSWTAISRVPWLKAIVLLGKGDTWNGGGLFLSNSRYWLDDGCGHFLVRDSREVERDMTYRPHPWFHIWFPGIYYVRLQRDGWVLKDQLKAGSSSAFTVFERELPEGWVLRKYSHSETGAPPGKGCHWDEHELEHTGTSRRLSFPRWEWADLDGGTLVWAEGGCLHRAPLLAEGLGMVRMLFDFNDLSFERRVAPY